MTVAAVIDGLRLPLHFKLRLSRSRDRRSDRCESDEGGRQQDSQGGPHAGPVHVHRQECGCDHDHDPCSCGQAYKHSD